MHRPIHLNSWKSVFCCRLAVSLTAVWCTLSFTYAEDVAGLKANQFRQCRSIAEDLSAIREYLLECDPETRRNLRFFTLNHWYNNSDDYSTRDLQLARSAVAKLINCLSWQPEIVHLEVIPNSNESILAIDLRHLAWTDADQWLRIMNEYPYGLRLIQHSDQQIRAAASDIERLTESELPCLRADWFVVAAAQSPLYERLLDLPIHAKDLERRIGVDVYQNLIDGEAARAAVLQSGVSNQNRLVERHPTQYGAYWITYNFRPRQGRGDLIRYPLGPTFKENEFNRHAFEHDLCAASFHLPNGLQAYFLSDANGNRIDTPIPVDVLFDKEAVAGTPALQVGLSCISCHREGVNGPLQDGVREAAALTGDALEKVRQLYIDPTEMNKLVALDRERFQVAQRSATEMFLPTARVTDDSSQEWPEPIGYVTRLYFKDLGPQAVAAELGLESLHPFRYRLLNDRSLQRLGLGTLARDVPGTIKRTRWEAVDGTSLFQDVAVELRIGTPLLPGSRHGIGASRTKPVKHKSEK